MQESELAMEEQSNPIKDKKEKIQKQKILNEQEKIKEKIENNNIQKILKYIKELLIKAIKSDRLWD